MWAVPKRSQPFDNQTVEWADMQKKTILVVRSGRALPCEHSCQPCLLFLAHESFTVLEQLRKVQVVC